MRAPPPPLPADAASVNGVIPPGTGGKGAEKGGRGGNGRGADGRGYGGGRGAFGREPPPQGGPPSKDTWQESQSRY